MTTEEAFQAQLDAEPDNHLLREIFADFLEENDDPRADGYRALGVNQRLPYWRTPYEDCRGKAYWSNYWHSNSPLDLPVDWFLMLEMRGKGDTFAPDYRLRSEADDPCYRREAEDAAALAFAKLPAARRAELLKREPCPA